MALIQLCVHVLLLYVKIPKALAIGAVDALNIGAMDALVISLKDLAEDDDGR